MIGRPENEHADIGPGPVAAPSDLDWLQLGSPRSDPFTLSLTISEAHIGRLIAHVPNTTVVHWLEQMATAHSNAVGRDERWYNERNLIWFVRRHEIDYLGEIRSGDTLAMATWVDSFSKVSSPRKYIIARADDQSVLVRAMTVWVLVDRTTSRPQRIDESLFAPYLK